MPFARPSLSTLRAQVLQDIAAALPGSDPLLRFSNLNTLGQAQAGLAYLHYGFLDWIAAQSNPFTASGEYLEAWAALKDVYRTPATRAAGPAVQFTGTNGSVVPAGTPLVRGDGFAYATTADGTVALGVVSVPVQAVADPAGLLGAQGNAPVGAILVIGTAVAGVNSNGTVTTAITGGADLETDDALRARMLFAYQNPPHGGSRPDYVEWATAVAGVTRAWCVPNIAGPGSVTVYFMMDDAESAHQGFPQGTNGVSQYDQGAGGVPRNTVATGDQLLVADALVSLQPVTALVYAVAPTPSPVNFTIAGIATASAGTKAAISAAIDDTLRQHSNIGAGATVVDLSYIESAIGAIANTAGFVITSPPGNISVAAGALPIRGTVTYT